LQELTLESGTLKLSRRLLR